MSTAGTMRVLSEVLAERASQNVKWGEQNHPDGTGPDMRIVEVSGVTNSELEDRARSRCDRMRREGKGTFEQILTEEWAEAIACDNPADLRAELIQVAAVAVAWVEAINRRTA